MTDEKVTLAASDEAVKNMVDAMDSGAKPDFTVTAATLREAHDTYVIFAWETKSAGFGELTFFRKGGKLLIDNEGMSARFCKEVLSKVVDQAFTDSGREP